MSFEGKYEIWIINKLVNPNNVHLTMKEEEDS